MSKHAILIVDAFVDLLVDTSDTPGDTPGGFQPGSGNPAAVLLLDNWLSDEAMQAIAFEQDLSETAFLVRAVDDDIDYRLRWFTPACEIDLCGHATMAAAHAVREWATGRGEPAPDSVVFGSRSGRLAVTHDPRTERLKLDFPARPAAQVHDNATINAVAEALNTSIESMWSARVLMAVLHSPDALLSVTPNFSAISALHDLGVIVTASVPASLRDGFRGADVVSRFFAPAAGVAEDPVTGSAHCTIAPYWAERLGKPELVCRQLSDRGGMLWCRHRGHDERVDLGGHAVTQRRADVSIHTSREGKA